MLDWSKRTFGMELEFADVSADVVDMPRGYYIDTLETLTNSDGSIGRFGVGKGVEICRHPSYQQGIS